MATPIIMPRQGQSVESCILTSWNVREGEAVALGQVVASIETDKATFEVESPAEGILLARLFEEGADIPVLTNIAVVGQPGEDISHLRPGAGESHAEVTHTHPTSAQNPLAAPVASFTPPPPSVPGTGISPRARKAAEQHGIAIAGLAGSGPGGRIIERDVITAKSQSPALSGLAKDARASGLTPPPRGSGPGGRVLSGDMTASAAAPVVTSSEPTITPVKGIRKIIAEKMKLSLQSTAQLTLTRSFDASIVQSFRARAKEHPELCSGPKITINDLIVYAAVQALKKHPSLNAHFLGDRIVTSSDIHIGIAVDTPRGLMVPVVHHTQQMSLAELSASIKPIAESALKGNVNPDLLSGGTFTITNLGSLGVETFTPVLNPPEVAILGVGGISLKPVRKNGEVIFVDAITLSLTIDHQAVDGAPAARFLQELCLMLENIDLLLSR